MAQVTRVHKIEGAVAHDHFVRARIRSEDVAELVAGLDLAPVPDVAAVLSVERHDVSLESMANHVRVACSIDAGSHTGASRQNSMFRSISATPCSKVIRGSQPSSRVIFVMSAQVQSGSPGRFGT